MGLLTPAVLLILIVAALCALLTFRIHARFFKGLVLTVATALCAFAIWLGASDAWAFRDGFPIPAPSAAYPETHGVVAIKMFLLSFWVPLLGGWRPPQGILKFLSHKRGAQQPSRRI